MKKWVCGILVFLLVAICACSLAEDVPVLTFVEQERINYKPILKGNRDELEVDNWLQTLAVENEDYFWSVDPEGPIYSFEQISGPATDAHIDKNNVLRMDSVQQSPCMITFRLTAEWAGQTAETNMYIEFFDCEMPTAIGFSDEYTLYVGETLKLDADYDNGKWPYRDWRGLYPQKVSSYDIIGVRAEEYPDNSGASTYITGRSAGTATVLLQANQNGLNWYKTVTITIIDFTDKQGSKYSLDFDKKTAILQQGAKSTATVTVPDTVKVKSKKFKVVGISAEAFRGNKKIKTVKIGKNVSIIGKEAFSGCTKLSKVTGMAGVTTISEGVFQKCTSLAAVTIPEKVKKIGKNAFNGDKKLKTITINTTKLTSGSVGSNAFKGIHKKATIKCPKAKLKAYKKFLVKKGVPKTAEIIK